MSNYKIVEKLKDIKKNKVYHYLDDIFIASYVDKNLVRLTNKDNKEVTLYKNNIEEENYTKELLKGNLSKLVKVATKTYRNREKKK